MVSKTRTINLVSKLNPDVFALINKDIYGAPELPLGSIHGAVNRIISPEYTELLKATMPTLLSLHPNDQNWFKRVKNYWDSFSLRVPIGGKTLEIGFNFDIKDYTKKEAINDLIASTSEIKKDKEGENVTVATIVDDETLASYILKNIPEFEKYKYATPINVEQYLIWLFCLGHRKVAKEAQALDKSTNIEFILIDPKEIEDTRRKQHTISVEAIKLYLELLTNRSKVKDILYVRGVNASELDDTDCDSKLKEFSDSNPKEFIAIAKDNTLTTKARIERYCVAGVLRRLSNSSIIVDANDNGIVIGNTTDEAVAFFSSESAERVAKVKELQARYAKIMKH